VLAGLGADGGKVMAGLQRRGLMTDGGWPFSWEC